jgi:hypothetical protein
MSITRPISNFKWEWELCTWGRRTGSGLTTFLWRTVLKPTTKMHQITQSVEDIWYVVWCLVDSWEPWFIHRTLNFDRTYYWIMPDRHGCEIFHGWEEYNDAQEGI